jgi:aldehyde:ferredoxin oxidoreductase
MFGWRGRLLRVDLTSGAITREQLDPGVARSYLGGRGLGTYLHAEEVPSSTAPLSAENHLIFVTGPLTGTLAPNGGRYTVITRTPPGGELTAASISGKWGPELKFAGFDAIIFEGAAADPVYLWVNDGKAELRPALHVWGKTVTETTEALVKETDERAIVSCIGPAGENGVNCSLVVSDYFSAAGGIGTGAVMGSKNLKAVVVCGTEGFRLANHRRFLKSATELRSWMATRPIAAKGSLRYDSVLLAKSLSWDTAPQDFKPARTRGCFGCATSFSSFVYDGGKGFLPLSAGSPHGELSERMKEYRFFTDLGLEFSAAREMLDSLGNDATGNHTELARKLACGDELGAKVTVSNGLDIDHGPCIAAGYAIIPRVPAGNGQDEARTDLMAVLDSAGLCPYLVAGIGMDTVAELLTAATGVAFSQDEIIQAGQRISWL